MTGAALQEATKDELKERILKIKERQKREKIQEKEKQANLMESLIALGTAGGLSFYQGGKEKEVRDANADFDTLPLEKKQELLAEAQGVAGIDLDLLVGGAGLVMAMTDMAGEYAGTFRAVGTGALSSWSARFFYNKAAHAVDEEEGI